MWDLIKREPARFGGFVQTLFGLLAAIVAVSLPDTMDPTAKAAIVGGILALGHSASEFVRYAVVPTVKLSEHVIEKAADMTKADIKRVEATK